MNMIEKVARGIAQDHYARRFKITNKPEENKHVQENVNGNWNIFINEAKAAIAAMREPTEEMVQKAYAGQKDAINAGFAQAYRTMIDAALKG